MHWRMSATAMRWTRGLLRVALVLGLVLGLVLAGGPATARAQATWLDEPVAQWNQPGMAVPGPVRGEREPGIDPRCTDTIRPAETPFDAAVEAAGWSLFNTYQGGWGVTIVFGLNGHDGMCRPWAYHGFVFVDGQFAGTLAPVASLSRTDGALTSQVRLGNDGAVAASFVRYADSDPLCCPSRPSVSIRYRVERTPAGPVLLVDQRSEVPRGS